MKTHFTGVFGEFTHCGLGVDTIPLPLPNPQPKLWEEEFALRTNSLPTTRVEKKVTCNNCRRTLELSLR